MVAWNVERLEVVRIGLDLGALGDREAEAGEDRDDLVAHARERMQAAAWRPAAGQREIGALALALPPALGRARDVQTPVEQLHQLALGLVGGGAHLRPLFRRQRGE